MTIGMKDIFGKAILDYYNGNYTEDIVTSTNISDEDVLPLPYLFREYKDMPNLEKKALELAKGSVLDTGCGTGSHSLYLEKRGLSVKAIDISKGAIDVANQRGVKNAQLLNFIDETEPFDTILLLMNGTGIFQTLAQSPYFLNHLKTLLNPGGQILLDSSDIQYMYETDDGGMWIDINSDYYGELDYTIKYKGMESTLPWLYLDFDNLRYACKLVGLKCELVLEGEHFDYLARITV